jgi:predicted phage baseplate assembly protein
MTLPCGCCTGNVPLTPVPTANPPGLSALVYRVGTYSSFFSTMMARLSSSDFPALAGLQTRETDDPAIALLDAWATIADVLTFYQERIANEGYLRTATERQSILELAKLVGYRLRPGVAASVYLAYTLDPNNTATTGIPAGSRTQSVPAQDQLPQSFETADDLTAQSSWNNLAPRLTQPQMITPDTQELYIDGTNANLNANDPLLVIASPPQLKFISAVDVQFNKSRTKVTLQSVPPNPGTAQASSSPFVALVDLMAPLSMPPASHPRDSLHLQRSTSKTFAQQEDTTPALLKTLRPQVEGQLYTALGNASVTPPVTSEIHAFRVRTGPFGSTAPLKPVTDAKGVLIGTEEWPLVGNIEIEIVLLPEGGIVRGAEALIAEARLGREASIRIKTPMESASAAFSLSPVQQTVKVGPWSVAVSQNVDRAAASIEFFFEAPLSHKIVLSLLEKSQQVEVTVDNAVNPIAVARGQTAATTSGGDQTLVSFENNLSVFVKASIAPNPNVLALDTVYNEIIPGSWLTIERVGRAPQITQVSKIETLALTNYGMSARVSQLTLKDPWLNPAKDRMLTVARQTTVSAQSEKLTLAEEPILDDLNGGQIELGKLYSDLDTGRWLIVQGERTDIANTHGVTGTELVMLDGVEQRVQQVVVQNPAASNTQGSSTPANAQPSSTTIDRPGDSTHSFLRLASGLAYTYKRDTASIYGNVVRATNGETRNEILGNGDATQALQKFTLRNSPLTYIPASTAKGMQSTLQVFSNDIPWKEIDTLAKAGPTDRVFTTKTDNYDVTTITFGDGVHGMRLPTGVQNVRAVYRIQTGTAGSMDASQISMLVTRPLGVSGVSNPVPASGAADRDSTDQARGNTPLAVAALDRLVSVEDYADFARTFAGIGKASAAQLSDGRQLIVYMTIASTDGSPIDPNSDLFLNLLLALRQLGDPNLALRVDLCELMLLVISAKVQVLANYQFQDVAPLVRAALLSTFGFAKRDLGQSVPLSEVITAVQQVPGVSYVDVTAFDSISESDVASADALSAKLAAIASASAPKQNIPVRSEGFNQSTNSLEPAQLAFLSPDVPDTLILTEIPS